MSFREDIIDKLGRLQDLPALPEVVTKLTRMMSDVNASAGDISKLVQFDPSLAGRILRVANSAAFGGTTQVGSIPQAITRIGFKRLKDIVLSMTFIRTFRNRAIDIDFTRFWRHSLSVAFACQEIEQLSPQIETASDEAFSAGLLHDLGVLILALYAPTFYRRVVAYALSENKDLCQAEQLILCIDHAEVGAMLLEKWGLPELVIESVRCHHDPYPAGRPTGLLTKVVHLANFACNNQGIDSGMGTFPSTFSSGAWYDVGLKVEDIPAIIGEVNRRTSEADDIIAAAG